MKKEGIRDKFIERGRPILQRLESAGFEAWLVGGCVRETLRAEAGQTDGLTPTDIDITTDALPPTDIDITTNALPEETCQVFSDLQVIGTGLKHGTVTVLLPPMTLAPQAAASRGIPVEITTYRVDGAYSDGRHPDQVRFVTSLTEDLRRRDFTVNAMAMDQRGEIADPFGGQADLNAGIIRAVGDPDTRFREDGLRILRALRFAAVLDYEIEPETEAALRRCAPLLKGISAERIFVELKKLVCGKAAGRVVRRYIDILSVVIPQMMPMKGFEQNNPYHKYDVLEHCVRAMEAVRPVAPEPAGEADMEIGPEQAGEADMETGLEPVGEADMETAPEQAQPGEPESVRASDPTNATPEDCMKLAALLHDIGKPGVYSLDENGIGHFYGHPEAGAKIVRQIMEQLKADRATSERMETLIRHHDMIFQEDDRLLKRWMNRYGPQVLLEILEIKRADNIATGNVSQELLDKFDRIEKQIRQLIRDKACFSIRDLKINGKDLIGAGVPEGPRIGRILSDLLEEVIDGACPNERDALMARAEALRRAD